MVEELIARRTLGRPGGSGRFAAEGFVQVVTADGTIRCTCRGWRARDIGPDEQLTSSTCAHADAVDDAIVGERAAVLDRLRSRPPRPPRPRRPRDPRPWWARPLVQLRLKLLVTR